MKKAELTPEQRVAVLNKDPHDLQRAVSAELKRKSRAPIGTRAPSRMIDMQLYVETCCIEGGGDHEHG